MATWAGEAVSVDQAGKTRTDVFYRSTARAAWTAVREHLERAFLDGLHVQSARILQVEGD